MQVTTANVPMRASQAAKPQQSPTPAPEEKVDEFKANSPDKNRIGYEVAYNVGNAVGEVFKGGAKVGQFLQLSSSAIGAKPGAVAGSLGIIGGALDVAIGTSTAKQSAINRNTLGCALGGLQVAQGVATWVSVGATMANLPGVVGQAASIAALGAMAGRYAMMGVGAFSAREHKDEKQSGNIPPGTSKMSLELRSLNDLAQMGSQSVGVTSFPKGMFGTLAAIPETPQDIAEKEERESQPRGFEKTFAAVNAVDSWAQRLGGVGAMMNNFDAIRNQTPDGIWAPIGLVGGTYSLVQGVGMLKHSAVNRNLESTVTSAFDVVGGAATIASSLGAGRVAGIAAAGAWVGKTAYTIWSQSRRLGASEEGQGVAGVIGDALKNSFWGQSKENFADGVFKSVPSDKEKKTDEKPPADPPAPPEEPGKAA